MILQTSWVFLFWQTWLPRKVIDLHLSSNVRIRTCRLTLESDGINFTFNIFIQSWFYFLALGQPYFTVSTLYSISWISWQLQQRSNRVDRHLTNWLLLKNYGTRRTVRLKILKSNAKKTFSVIPCSQYRQTVNFWLKGFDQGLLAKKTNLTVRFRP